MSTNLLVRADELQPADIVNFTGNEPFLHPDNIPAAQHEYACIESVNGGWADAVATSGNITIYTENYPLPIILPANTTLTIEGRAA